MEQINKKITYTGTIPECPYCEKPTQRTEGLSMVTALYHAPVYDCNGLNINPAKNEKTTEWGCCECKKNYITRGSIYIKPTFDKLTAEERLLKILHSCNRITYSDNPNYVGYGTETKSVIVIDKKNSKFICDDIHLWDIFSTEYDMSESAIKEFLNVRLQKYFKLASYTAHRIKFKITI